MATANQLVAVSSASCFLVAIHTVEYKCLDTWCIPQVLTNYYKCYKSLKRMWSGFLEVLFYMATITHIVATFVAYSGTRRTCE